MALKNVYQGRAIVTYGRSLMSLVIARSLADKGVEVISCDSVGMTATSFSKYTTKNFIHADPAKDETAYLNDLEQHIQAHKPDDDRPYILIPAFRDAKRLARHVDRFSTVITVAAANFDAMDKVDPKHHLLRTLEGLPIKAPKTWHPTTESAVESAVNAITVPALIKAVDEVGGRGIDFVDHKDVLLRTALKRLDVENPPPLLQEAVEGDDYCFGVIYKNGELVAHMAYRNLQNLPSEGGAGAMRETVDDAPFIKASNQLMGAIKWSGIAEIDFRWTGNPEDTPSLIEVNPRFWAGIFQSVESGVDFPWILYHLFAYGYAPEVGEAKIDTKTRLPGLWVAGAIKDAFDQDADMDSAKTAWESMKQDVRAGAYGTAMRSLGQAVSKATNFDDALSYLRTQSEHARDAKSELSFEDDPMAAFGVFFILSSLIRHGELPDEIKD